VIGATFTEDFLVFDCFSCLLDADRQLNRVNAQPVSVQRLNNVTLERNNNNNNNNNNNKEMSP